MNELYKVKISKKDYESLFHDEENWKLVEYLYKQVMRKLRTGEEFELSDELGGLTEYWIMDEQIKNGGYIQCFFNGYARDPEYITAFLRFLGNEKLVENYLQAHKLYLKYSEKFIKKPDWVWGDIEALSKDPELQDLKSLSKEYYKITENIYELINENIDKNKELFLEIN